VGSVSKCIKSVSFGLFGRPCTGSIQQPRALSGAVVLQLVRFGTAMVSAPEIGRIGRQVSHFLVLPIFPVGVADLAVQVPLSPGWQFLWPLHEE
jgi:hypothetical protein